MSIGSGDFSCLAFFFPNFFCKNESGEIFIFLITIDPPKNAPVITLIFLTVVYKYWPNDARYKYNNLQLIRDDANCSYRKRVPEPEKLRHIF